MSEPYAATYRSTSSSVAGTGARGARSDDGVPDPAVRQVDARSGARAGCPSPRMASSAFRGIAGANVSPTAARSGAWSRAVRRRGSLFSMPSASRRAQHVRVDVRLVGEDLAHRRAGRGHRERVAEQRAAGRDRLLLVDRARPAAAGRRRRPRSCRRRRAARRRRSTCPIVTTSGSRPHIRVRPPGPTTCVCVSS